MTSANAATGGSTRAVLCEEGNESGILDKFVAPRRVLRRRFLKQIDENLKE